MNLPQDVLSLSSNHSPCIDTLRIDLVKAVKLGLTLKEAASLSLIHQLIQKQLAKHLVLSSTRWWVIDGETLATHSNLVAGHADQGQRLITALVSKRLLEAKTINTGPIARIVIRLNTKLVLLDAAP